MTEIDPVCGMTVDTENAMYTSDYKGKRYYFCSPGCKADFENNPEHYVSKQAARGGPHAGGDHSHR